MDRVCHIVLCVVLMVSLPSDIAGQRGSPFIKKPVPAPAPVVPITDLTGIQGNTNPSTGNLQVNKAADDEAMRHIEELENTVTTMKLDNAQMEQTVNQLRMATFNLQRTLGVMASKISELDKLANQNKELTRMLTYFETFFGVLYSEAPEAFDSTVPVETRLSKMNSYLGNREATLAELRPKPNHVVQQPEPAGVSDEVANAVIQLSQENAVLASKVSNLETNVASTNEEIEQAKAKASTTNFAGRGTTGGGCTCGENMEERLEFIEDTLDAYLSTAAKVSDSSLSSKKAGAVTIVPLMSDDDVADFRSGLLSSRSVSSSRKSVFSAIRHRPMLGDTDRQVLHFDSVHVNKGGHFQNNTIFNCSTEGFYFFQFTVRSYDGHYMGVALVKNSEMMTSVYTDASERSIMQSQSTVLHMRPGDMVWLELGSSERFAVHSDIHKYVTFNGFLIYKGR
ncbi:uncharacterized protein [Amphiura filiformis]|uniref:uncharacterized protein n=1 Tax=Amphiura filiformis TaxID=82378 RepID=UPI003B227B39